MGGDGAFEWPKAPVVFAGGIGGPSVYYFVTPARNALTLGAQDTSASIVDLYRQVFSRGLASGWTGGAYPAMAACPQFLCLGPVYHGFASVAGSWGGLLLTGMVETGIAYGAETKNAQMASIEKGIKIPEARVQNPLMPWGPGITAHVARNVFAMVGMRVLAEPITKSLEAATGTKDNATVGVVGDLLSNIAAAGITFPIHQLFNYTVSTPEMWDKPQGEQIQMAKDYLNRQYFITKPDGAKQLSPILLRDFGLRSLYIGCCYTMYINLERACVKNWPL
jgi:hypothetical protein